MLNFDLVASLIYTTQVQERYQVRSLPRVSRKETHVEFVAKSLSNQTSERFPQNFRGFANCDDKQS